ncbi:aurora kinase A-like [Ictalurus furcatus]|uniref:aurora kinase A-like n=1 Tax=Ictalurus furcatus TaxID=66913 RepID=UPI0023503BE8|nr:aurora kinase A-like [Ictalurus furcatus]
MGSNCLVSGPHFARMESQQNPLKRMDLAPEQPELQSKEKPVKKRRRMTEEKDVKTEKTETCVEAPCSVNRRVSKVNPLKRKRMDLAPEQPELQPKEKPVKTRRRMTEEKDVKTEKTETCVEAPCPVNRRVSKVNPLKRKRMDLAPEQPELQPKEKPVKKRRRMTEEKDVKTEKTETCVEAPCPVNRRVSKVNPLKRKKMDFAPEQPELQPKEKPVKNRRRETKEKDVKTERTATYVEASCSINRRVSKVNPLKRKRMDAPPEGPKPQPKEQKRAEKMRRTETEENNVKTKKRANIFSRYTLGKRLGEGGFAFVYAGVRKSDRKKVALKFMYRSRVDPYITLPGDTRRLPLEVALMELVCKPPHCPCVIELLEWFETPAFFLLVLERPDPCVDLLDYCKDLNMSECTARTIMQQVLFAALHCRDRGVIHRDITESNILLNPQTLDVKLIDFGCGDLLKDTRFTEFSGTRPLYPPEWITEAEYEAEPATVWALGILLYQLLCKAKPFSGDHEIVYGHLDFPDDLSEASCSLIKWCLQRDPKRRPTLEQILAHHWF